MDQPSTIFAAARLLAAGECAPLELVDHALDRIARYEPLVSAWVAVDAEGARETAIRLAQTARSGEPRSPLWGIPLGIKDVFDIVGQPTLAGAPIRKGHRAQTDATVVARLRNAGAILLGKTVTTEFACFDPPPTRNPWNLEHTPGGSSSGSAAALALGMCLGAVGTQTGGSIIRPAAYCGVCGLKPSFGRVSFHGVVGVTTHLDHAGPMARCVEDLGLLYEAIAGPDPHDEFTVTASVADCASAIAAGRDRPPRLLLLEDGFLDETDAAIRGATERALDLLRAAGAAIDRKAGPDFAAARLMHRRIMLVEGLATHRATYPARRSEYGPRIAALLDEATRVSAVEYSDAVRHQQVFRRQQLSLFHGVDALIMPATDTAAPGLDTTGSPRFQSPWSYTGWPEVTFPCGLTSSGLPAGLQLVGPPWSEAPLLAAAAWCQRVLDFQAQPAL